MSENFVVGDHVRVTKDQFHEGKIGEVLTTPIGKPALMAVQFDDGKHWFDPASVTKLSESAFKVGDRVRVVGNLIYAGREGTVGQVLRRGTSTMYGVRVDDSGLVMYLPHQLEPVVPEEEPVTDVTIHHLSPSPESLREYADWISYHYPNFTATPDNLRNIADTEERKAAQRTARIDKYARVFNKAWCRFYGTEPMTDEVWAKDSPARSGSAIRAGIEAVLDAVEGEPTGESA